MFVYDHNDGFNQPYRPARRTAFQQKERDREQQQRRPHRPVHRRQRTAKRRESQCPSQKMEADGPITEVHTGSFLLTSTLHSVFGVELSRYERTICRARCSRLLAAATGIPSRVAASSDE